MYFYKYILRENFGAICLQMNIKTNFYFSALFKEAVAKI